MKKLARSLLLAVFFATADSLPAMFASPEDVPIDRLLQNIEAHLAKRPDSAEAYYTLGRIHYIAFILQTETVPAFLNFAPPLPDGTPSLPELARETRLKEMLEHSLEEHAYEMALAELGRKSWVGLSPSQLNKANRASTKYKAKLVKEHWRPNLVPSAQLADHAEKAIAAMQKAIDLDPKKAAYPLGLASLFEQLSEWVISAKISQLPVALKGDLRATARGLYLWAWSLAKPAESRAVEAPIDGPSAFVSYEAGEAFLRLAKGNEKKLSVKERAALPQVNAAIDTMKKLPGSGYITPLVIALEPHTHLDELLAHDHTAEFDLRGYGVAEWWPWVNGNAGLLVWDPQDRRSITSGRQLFGSYTFQLFWATGYDALRALDDNGDGQLTGSELNGLSLWFDRNGDARSTRDEVAPLATFGIRALAVDAPAFDGPHPTNPHGVTFTDGRTLPTWDWIAAPVHESVP